jgi:hypothetical protein
LGIGKFRGIKRGIGNADVPYAKKKRMTYKKQSHYRPRQALMFPGG